MKILRSNLRSTVAQILMDVANGVCDAEKQGVHIVQRRDGADVQFSMEVVEDGGLNAIERVSTASEDGKTTVEHRGAVVRRSESQPSTTESLESPGKQTRTATEKRGASRETATQQPSRQSTVRTAQATVESTEQTEETSMRNRRTDDGTDTQTTTYTYEA